MSTIADTFFTNEIGVKITPLVLTRFYTPLCLPKVFQIHILCLLPASLSFHLRSQIQKHGQAPVFCLLFLPMPRRDLLWQPAPLFYLPVYIFYLFLPMGFPLMLLKKGKLYC